MATNRPSKQYSINLFRKICKQLGLKLTHQRLEIYNAMMDMEDHPSVEEVFDAIKPKIPTISFDTVYRTLALFERNNIIQRIQYLDSKTRYDSNMDEHYHLVCKRCHNIQDFYWPDMDNLKAPDDTNDWGKIDNRYLELRGVCQGCLARDKVA